MSLDLELKGPWEQGLAREELLRERGRKWWLVGPGGEAEEA